MEDKIKLIDFIDYPNKTLLASNTRYKIQLYQIVWIEADSSAHLSFRVEKTIGLGKMVSSSKDINEAIDKYNSYIK